VLFAWNAFDMIIGQHKGNLDNDLLQKPDSIKLTEYDFKSHFAPFKEILNEHAIMAENFLEFDLLGREIFMR
jgi:hypothetical protein